VAGVAAAAGLAAVLGFGMAMWLEPLHGRTAGLAAALAAALAVAVIAAPLSMALARMARRGVVPSGARAGVPTQAAAALPEAAAAGAGRAAAAEAAAPAPEASTAPGGEGGRGAATSAALAGLAPQGLALSREMFMDMVAREWSRARRYGTGAALLLVEIDRYPRLTDALGHAAGEKVLAEVLGATAPTLRGADALARYEAGRFTVFLAHADATGALDVAERIRERAEQLEVTVPPRRVRFTVSVGVAHLRPAHLYLQALVDDVVDALAAARQAGGNCVRAAPVDAGPRPAPGAARDGSRADKK
jgi:diguanylate cyclase (GGDEF)-like protein